MNSDAVLAAEGSRMLRKISGQDPGSPDLDIDQCDAMTRFLAGKLHRPILP